MSENVIAPGSRVEIRDAEWLVKRVDRNSTGVNVYQVVGLSELVKDKEARFLEDLDPPTIIDPAETELVVDDSSSFKKSLLYMESLLRQKPPTDDKLYVGDKAAIDPVPFQLDPAIQALEQPRQRILIADQVGLGKTIECGVLLSELIRRGRGKRILVCTLKSLMTQFQKEMWSRFTIPLVSVDSNEIQKIRRKIPSSHNPFFYYDKTIVSIDTIKRDAEYRTYLENCNWDIIVIDEAHNVAERGSTTSQRARLAKLLSRQSDTLIMLSATPHDGKPKSFASLMNMLDATAVADPEDYEKDDIEGLFVRRFKKDVKEQVEKAFRDRIIYVSSSEATAEEEAAFGSLVNLDFDYLDEKRGGGMLFRISLEKALFSSPVACLETINNRIERLQDKDDSYERDLQQLQTLADDVKDITPGRFSKYQQLLKVLHGETEEELAWDGSDSEDRLVIFTERIATMNFLKKQLLEELDLDEEEVEVLHGSLSDVEQQQVVEDFGKDNAPIRLLIASDMASEGIDLHHLCHRMIHFDIPWSLMVFKQRNGRIDRYGQTDDPRIVYLKTESENEKIKGDSRILEILIKKDEQAYENIGDPQFFMDVYDLNEEEQITAEAIETGKSEEEFERELDENQKEAWDILDVLRGEKQPVGEKAEQAKGELPSLFHTDYNYLKTALKTIQKEGQNIQTEFNDENQTAYITGDDDIQHRFRDWPDEFVPKNWEFKLSSGDQTIKKEIKRSRQDESAWPKIQYLWEHHPLMEWVNDKAMSLYERSQAPVIVLKDVIDADETIYLLSGLVPNKKSQPLVHRWLGVRYRGSKFEEIIPFDELLDEIKFGQKSFPNPERSLDLEQLSSRLGEAIDMGRTWVLEERDRFQKQINQELNEQLERLKKSRRDHLEHVQQKFENWGSNEKAAQTKIEQEQRQVQDRFKQYQEWIENTMTTERSADMRVIAVFKGDSR